ncbi:unnamed protein product [Mesocestoides corti]|uniref:Uncharacterized protein n=1 Tax=Mesocestoides corti TaxID=53468 RepID=A0A0R3U9S5_MESCO|nr:unnamed protein product [Mesocestoides corti]
MSLRATANHHHRLTYITPHQATLPPQLQPSSHRHLHTPAPPPPPTPHRQALTNSLTHTHTHAAQHQHPAACTPPPRFFPFLMTAHHHKPQMKVNHESATQFLSRGGEN